MSGIPPTHSWCISHPDVTPVVVRALVPYATEPEIAMAVAHGQARMQADRLAGHNWPAFWWKLHWYTTAAWLQTLTAMQAPMPALKLYSGKVETLQSAADVDVALLLECLLMTGQQHAAQLLVRHLIRRQGEDGLWPGVPILRVTRPEVHRPWETENGSLLYADGQGIYSAATILSALARFSTL